MIYNIVDNYGRYIMACIATEFYLILMGMGLPLIHCLLGCMNLLATIAHAK